MDCKKQKTNVTMVPLNKQLIRNIISVMASCDNWDLERASVFLMSGGKEFQRLKAQAPTLVKRADVK